MAPLTPPLPPNPQPPHPQLNKSTAPERQPFALKRSVSWSKPLNFYFQILQSKQVSLTSHCTEDLREASLCSDIPLVPALSFRENVSVCKRTTRNSELSIPLVKRNLIFNTKHLVSSLNGALILIVRFKGIFCSGINKSIFLFSVLTVLSLKILKV